jgi:predicted enzyme related to lactoylglutathione lyase
LRREAFGASGMGFFAHIIDSEGHRVGLCALA